MKERPTPETDIIAADDNPLFRPWRRRICEHARKLERQRDELLEALDKVAFYGATGCLQDSLDEAKRIARAAIATVKGTK